MEAMKSSAEIRSKNRSHLSEEKKDDLKLQIETHDRLLDVTFLKTEKNT